MTSSTTRLKKNESVPVSGAVATVDAPESGQPFVPGASSRNLILQAKMTVGSSSDPLEKEADDMAAAFMAWSPDSATEGAPAEGDLAQPAVRRDASAAPDMAGSFGAPAEVESHIEQTRGSGGSLPDAMRSKMEAFSGTSLADVRVHTDAPSAVAADTIGAKAFTTGSDIYFGSNASPADTELLAHEVSHVVQQGAGGAVHRYERTKAEMDRFVETRRKAAEDERNRSRARATSKPAGKAKGDKPLMSPNVDDEKDVPAINPLTPIVPNNTVTTDIGPVVPIKNDDKITWETIDKPAQEAELAKQREEAAKRDEDLKKREEDMRAREEAAAKSDEQAKARDEEANKRDEEAKKREAALAEREAAAKKREEELDARDSAAAAAGLAAKDKADADAKKAEEEKNKAEADAKAKADELQAREDEANKRDEGLTKREADLDKREEELGGKEKTLADEQAKLDQDRADLQAQQDAGAADLKAKEDALKAREEALKADEAKLEDEKATFLKEQEDAQAEKERLQKLADAEEKEKPAADKKQDLFLQMQERFLQMMALMQAQMDMMLKKLGGSEKADADEVEEEVDEEDFEDSFGEEKSDESESEAKSDEEGEESDDDSDYDELDDEGEDDKEEKPESDLIDQAVGGIMTLLKMGFEADGEKRSDAVMSVLALVGIKPDKVDKFDDAEPANKEAIAEGAKADTEEKVAEADEPESIVGTIVSLATKAFDWWNSKKADEGDKADEASSATETEVIEPAVEAKADAESPAVEPVAAADAAGAPDAAQEAIEKDATDFSKVLAPWVSERADTPEKINAGSLEKHLEGTYDTKSEELTKGLSGDKRRAAVAALDDAMKAAISHLLADVVGFNAESLDVIGGNVFMDDIPPVVVVPSAAPAEEASSAAPAAP